MSLRIINATWLAAATFLWVTGCVKPGAVTDNHTPDGTAVAVVPVFGFDADTTTVTHSWTATAARSNEAVIYRNWLAYLAWRNAPDSNDAPHWPISRQRETRWFDVAGSWISPGMSSRVLRIEAVSSSEYVVETIHTNATPAEGLIERVYASRDGGDWTFTSALDHNTRGWTRRTIGSITYAYPASHRFDSLLARRATAFADSVATAFSLPPLSPLSYYLTGSGEEAIRLAGIENYRKYPGEVGAFSRPGVIVSGDPRLGEEYRHEIVHHLFKPLTSTGTVDGHISEGVAVWLGGTKGMTFTEAAQRLAAELHRTPTFTLDSALTRWDMDYGTAGAVLVQLAYEHGGNIAVKALFSAAPYGVPGTNFELVIQQQLGMGSWSDVSEAWQTRIQRAVR